MLRNGPSSYNGDKSVQFREDVCFGILVKKKYICYCIKIEYLVSAIMLQNGLSSYS